MRALMPTLLLSLALVSPAFAQQAGSTLPNWESLTPAQREVLIGPLRARWNDHPDMRDEMMARAQRWQTMTPEQRRLAQRGMRRWEGLNPDQQREARMLYHRMRMMSPEQRESLRKQWQSMTPEQRRAWFDANPAPQPPRP